MFISRGMRDISTARMSSVATGQAATRLLTASMTEDETTATTAGITAGTIPGITIVTTGAIGVDACSHPAS